MITDWEMEGNQINSPLLIWKVGKAIGGEDTGRGEKRRFSQVDASAQEEFSGVLAREKEGFREASIRL